MQYTATGRKFDYQTFSLFELALKPIAAEIYQRQGKKCNFWHFLKFCLIKKSHIEVSAYRNYLFNHFWTIETKMFNHIWFTQPKTDAIWFKKQFILSVKITLVCKILVDHIKPKQLLMLLCHRNKTQVAFTYFSLSKHNYHALIE